MGNEDFFLEKMNPKIEEGTYWICTLDKPASIPSGAIGFFEEKNSITVVLEQEQKPPFKCTEPKARISVGIDTPEGAEGFLARVSSAIAQKDKICTYIFSAYWQDHIFVTKEKAELAVEAIKELAQGVKK